MIQQLLVYEHLSDNKNARHNSYWRYKELDHLLMRTASRILYEESKGRYSGEAVDDGSGDLAKAEALCEITLFSRRLDQAVRKNNLGYEFSEDQRRQLDIELDNLVEEGFQFIQRVFPLVDIRPVTSGRRLDPKFADIQKPHQ